MTDTLTIPSLDLDAPPPAPDDHEPFAHLVKQDELAAAMANGTKCRALCGHEFDPKIMWPEGLPVCERCMALLNAMNGD